MKKLLQSIIACLAAITIYVGGGCQDFVKQKSFYEAAGWQAKDFFEDPNTIAVCEAIQSQDLASVKRLIESDADVNDVGADGMTPLLWALVSKEAEIFSALADAGADPGVVVESDFNTRGIIAEGTTVAHIAAFHQRSEFFMALLANQLDPNLRGTFPQASEPCTLFDALLSSHGERMQDRFLGLLSQKPQQSVLDNAAELAIRANEFALAESAIRAGANVHVYSDTGWGNMLHLLVKNEPPRPSRQSVPYNRLVAWLEDQGEDLEAARADIARWRSHLRSVVDPSIAAAARAAELKKREAAKTEIDGPPEDYVDRP
ncbi:MAG: ankyrin repeat domain-containing protein [Pirellulaceae bacterium]